MTSRTPTDRDSRLTHVDGTGRVRMVDVGAKEPTLRVARAEALVRAQPHTIQALRAGAVKKGDALAAARIAGIMAAKRTAELIPLCHPVLLTEVEVEIEVGEECVALTSRVACVGPTGVEMEALTAVMVAALTIYDMCKAVDRGMAITDVALLEKLGGRSGHWRRKVGPASGRD